MGAPKIIRDPVHGYITVNVQELKVIDTEIFQRLKRIRHVPAEAVYPGATHTRFEHSLGVAMLSELVFDSLCEKRCLDEQILREQEKYRNTVKYAGLLHDVGHTPLSHVCEEFGEDAGDLYDRYVAPHSISVGPRPSGVRHEWASCALSLKFLNSQLRSINIDLELFCRMITGREYEPSEKPWLNPLISILNSWMDVDKVDYILRDSKMSGAVLANIDKPRIVSSYDVRDNKLLLSRAGFSVVSQLVHGREALYLWLYTHHAVAYYQNLIKRFVRHLISLGDDFDLLFSVDGMANGSDDIMLYSVLHNQKNRDAYTQLLWKQIFGRQFYKALWKTPFECEELVGSFIRDKLLLNLPRLETDLTHEFSFPPYSVFAYEASFSTFEGDANIWVSVGEKPTRFDQKFNKSIYKDPKIIQKTPYIRVDSNLTGHRQEILSYLDKWSAT